MRIAAIIGLGLVLSGCVGAIPEEDAAQTFDRVKDSPPRLRAFLATMPKGADLHIHLSGTAYAESNLAAGVAAGYCLDIATMRIVAPPCAKVPDSPPKTPCSLQKLGDKPPLEAVMAEQCLVDRAIDAQSLRNFVAAPGVNAHDQFFNSFAKFGDSRQPGLMLAEELNRAGRQQVRHIEVMATFGSQEIAKVAATLPATDGPEALLARLDQQEPAAFLAAARAELDQTLAIARAQMGCDGSQPQPGCAVSLRFLQQITRTSALPTVATQTWFGFQLAAADPRVGGINIVSPEDNFVALRDYGQHMTLIGTMADRFPQVGVSLHAGELAFGLVAPEQLRSHIRDAVLIGRAQRIGHGVDVMYEDDPYGLLDLLARRGVAVEINLTSNDLILGVRGADHPFAIYLEEGVPTTLSTDDEGVSRIDLTQEYLRAVLEHGLDYADLKALSRRGLEYAFLPGASLWADPVAWEPVAPCAEVEALACGSFLAANEKARRQWELEQAFDAFEQAVSSPRR
jgi:hypothetical protein